LEESHLIPHKSGMLLLAWLKFSICVYIDVLVVPESQLLDM
jgi:hypothetical protein